MDSARNPVWDSTTGISSLSITVSEPGYSTCLLTGLASYTTAIYSKSNTLSQFKSYYVILNISMNVILIDISKKKSSYYIRGIDPDDIMLLCDPDDTITPLNDIRWKYEANIYNNPFMLNEAGLINGTISCINDSTIFDTNLSVVGLLLVETTSKCQL